MHSRPWNPMVDYRNVQRGPVSPLRKPCPKPPTARDEYALWVGNIPPTTTIMRLRDYFSKAMPTQQDLLSISYNPDARYAFINFLTELARMLAIEQAAYHLFDNKRLDCRIRQTGLNRSTKVNYGLDMGRPGQPISITPEHQQSSLHNKIEELSHFPEADTSQYGSEKFFVLKSYSLETLYRSLGSGLWHVPKRHIERLNHAFQTASKVYLIFSVNGSGKFFGYASMRAEIRDDKEWSSLSPGTDTARYNLEVLDDYESLNSDDEIPSNQPPRRPSLASCDSSSSTGSISYDPQRRKITWQAPWSCDATSPLSPSDDPLPPSPFAPSSVIQPTSETLVSDLARYTRPCEIKWLSTQSIPFEEIRGLRNPWNSNKEVHIARNFTAVEPASAMMLLTRWSEKEESVRSMGSGVVTVTGPLGR